VADKTYHVETRFTTKDESSKQLHDIGHAAEHAHEEAKGLKETLKEVGEAFLLFEGVEKGKEIFIGLNAELQQTKIMMTSVIGTNFGRPWERARETAGEFYEEFESFTEKFPTSVGELSQNMQILGSAISQAGGGMEDLKKITEGSVVASKALHVEANQLFMMLEGRVSTRSAGAMALLNSVGMTPEAWQRLSAEKRMALTERALGSDVMKSAQSDFAGSFSGQAAMLKDRAEMSLAKIGLPLFKAVNEELHRWNEWLDKNKEKVEEIGHVVGEKLVAGFEAIKTIGEFIYDHSGVLIKVAEAWAAVKIGGMLGEYGGAAGGAIGGVLGKGIAGYAIGGFGGGMIGGGMAMGGTGGNILKAAGVGYMIGEQIMKAGLGDAIQDAIDPTMGKFRDLKKSMDVFDKSLQEANESAHGLKGAAGTNTAANLKGFNDLTARQVEVLKDIQAGRIGGGPLGIGDTEMKDALKQVGFDPDEMKRLSSAEGRANMLKTLSHDLARNEKNLAGSTAATDAGMKFAMEHLTKDQREHLEVAKATQQIMQEQLALLAAGKQAMSPEQVAASLVAAQEIARINGIADSVMAPKINQTINVHIDQVSAKDPDRWIADLDDYAARRARSRTRAKGAPARGH